MRSFRHILVAVKDPGGQWSPATAKAAQIAKATGAGIELFHAIDARLYVDALSTFGNGIAQFEDEQSAPFKERLEALADRLRSHGIVVSTASVVDHPVYEAILRQAKLGGADLIVTDCHAGRHFVPSLLHLTDWEVARLSPVPVLIVRRPQLYHRPAILCAVDPGHTWAKPAGLEAEIIAAGTEISGAVRGMLHAVHACDSIAEDAGFDAAYAQARDSFDTLLRPTRIPADRRHLVGGNPADAIEHAVAETGAEILIMGSISRSGLKRIVVGNTAETLLYRLPCDLLIVKPEGFESRITAESRGARLIVTPACN
jgi:universal stress protein E